LFAEANIFTELPVSITNLPTVPDIASFLGMSNCFNSSKSEVPLFKTKVTFECDGYTVKQKEEFKPYLDYTNEQINLKDNILGTPTPLHDIVGRPLLIGDTVELFNGVENRGELTVCKSEYGNSE
jgi:hypothetical protein